MIIAWSDIVLAIADKSLSSEHTPFVYISMARLKYEYGQTY